MKEQIDNLINLIKTFNQGLYIEGCITGSCLLDYFEGQDVDVFVYNEESFRKLVFYCYYNNIFQLLDPLEQWKFEQYVNHNKSSLKDIGLTSIKFKYNLCIDFNIVLKKNCNNALAVVSSFDFDIIAKAYDIMTKEFVDLTVKNKTNDKIVMPNMWNPAFRQYDFWRCSRLLNQIERCFKYWDRGYNTDLVIKEYIRLIDELLAHQNVFNSVSFDERLEEYKSNLRTVKELCFDWLKHHTITKEQIELLKEKVKSI